MKKIFLITISYLSLHAAFAQADSIRDVPVDNSQMDISYFPVNYPLQKSQNLTKEALQARLIYSRPLINHRAVFGNLIQYNKIWRLGANESTEIEFFTPVKFGGTKVNKGRYTLYAIPGLNAWTFLLNSITDTWGSFSYDPAKDVAKVTVPVERLSNPVERFSMYFDKSKNGFNLVSAWDSVKLSLPISK